MRRNATGYAALALLAREGLDAKVVNGTRSGELSNEVSDGFDVPDFAKGEVETTVHVSYLRQPQEFRDETGDRSQAAVSIYVPSDVEVTDGDESGDVQATRITIVDTGTTYRVVDVFDYGAGVQRAMGAEVSP